MNVYELIINQIRATNGSLFVTSSAVIDTIEVVNTDYVKVTFDSLATDYHPFVDNDICIYQTWNTDGGGAVRYFIKVSDHDAYDNNQLKGRIYDTSGTLQSGSDVNTAVGNVKAGKALCRIGNSSDDTRQGGVYLTSDDSGAPFISVWNDITAPNEWGTSGKEKARFGNIGGISYSGGSIPAKTHGLWGDSVYLEGDITATSGYIGDASSGWKITSDGLVNTGGSADATISIGGTTHNSSDTAFYVDGAGKMSLKDKLVWDGNNLTVKGTIILSDDEEIAGPGMNWRGAWASGTTYAKYDAVSYGGKSWISENNGNQGNTPQDDANWDLLADDGDQGNSGSFVKFGYKNASSTPSPPTFSGSYASPSISGTGWSFNMTSPSAGEQTYVSQTTYAYDFSGLVTVSTPVPLSGEQGQQGSDGDPGADGNPGADGTNTAVVYAYKRANSDPGDKPSTPRNWTFASGTWNNNDLGNSWNGLITEAGTGTKLYMCSAVATGTGETDSVAASDWTSASL